MEEQITRMSKQEAIDEVKKFFKGNKKFVDQSSMLIASTDRFIGIDDNGMELLKDNWNWEKLCRVTIRFEYWNDKCQKYFLGYKSFTYRKGNQKYKHKNSTADIHDFSTSIIANTESSKDVDSYSWNA